jgi:Flp pilus assembly protein TadG
MGRVIRRRRGSALVHFALMMGFFCTSLFGAMEFGLIFHHRIQLTGACREGARRAAVGKPVAQIKAAVRNSAPLGVTDGQIAVEYNNQSDDAGSWVAAADNGAGTANAIPAGYLCRVRITSWPHRMVTGTYFSWLPGVSGPNFLMSANEAAIRE